ncbi:ferrous iron transport protein A [Streptomyces sp. NPDC051452]|uniref:ferrous iron transport protein A n=1 Tax=Streptomyces sp. NPDC051452 TaxID=3365654 RepID=UPI0037AFBA15
MSMVSAQLSASQKRDSSVLVDSAPAGRLADLRPGMSGEVIDIDESVEPSTARRLFDLGFAPGAEVTVLRKAPLGDPVVLRIAEYEVALRKAQTAGIRVRRTV